MAPRNIPQGTQVQTQSGQQPAGIPGGLNFIERPDDEDERDAVVARKAEADTFKGNLLTHQAPFEPIKSPNLINHEELPKWQEYEELRARIPTMGLAPKERAEIERQINADQKRIFADVQAKNKAATAAATQKHREDMQRIDDFRAQPEQREKIVAGTEGARQAIEAENKTLQSSNKPDEKNMGDYVMRTSPLGTMKTPEFSEAAARISTLNGGVTYRQAVQYGIILGSPVNRNEKGELQPGANKVNGKPVIGKGATAYTVVGRDGRNNVLVQMPDREVIRVPAGVMDQFAQVRERGYGEQRKWWAERRQNFETAAGDDWVTRQVKKVVPAIKGALQ
jgi:hypothetical protein